MTNKLNQFTIHNSLLTKILSILAPQCPSAFTLAETLIVMGIIGVVAALTLPNLNSSTGNKEKVAKVKKIYSNLNDAYGRAVAVYGEYDDWFNNDTADDAKNKRAAERLTEFMKISKDCAQNTTGCVTGSDTKKVYDIDGSSYSMRNTKSYNYLLADGTSLMIRYNEILFDIDGPNKGLHRMRNDIYGVYISSSNGGIYVGSADSVDGCVNHADIKQCTAWVVQNDNMDFLKCPSTLNATVTSCK